MGAQSPQTAHYFHPQHAVETKALPPLPTKKKKKIGPNNSKPIKLGCFRECFYRKHLKALSDTSPEKKFKCTFLNK